MGKDHAFDSFPLPADLPSCWWAGARYADTSLELYSAHDTQAEAEEGLAWVREETQKWVGERPIAFEVVRDGPDLRARERWAGGMSRPCDIAARWYWYRRNRDLLHSWAAPVRCRVLASVPSQGDSAGEDLLCSRIGGPAILPLGVAWPTIRVPSWGKAKRARLEQNYRALGLPWNPPFRGGFRGKDAWAAYLATYDLRGCFAFGETFPAAVSLFVCTYDELTDSYREFANASCPVGVVVPLYPHDRLELVSPPQGVICTPPQRTTTWDVPDFPPGSTDLGEVMQDDSELELRQVRHEELCKAIETRESGTATWITVGGNKIGGCSHFIQHSLVRLLGQQAPRLRWHLIATHLSDFFDDGELYILAGWDRKARKWHWHCESQSH